MDLKVTVQKESPKQSPPKVKQPSEVLYEKAVLKNFEACTGKHLCWTLFLIKLQAFRAAT